MYNVVFIMLKNVKMPTIGILTFMSRINFVLSWVEHEKSFMTSGPVVLTENTTGIFPEYFVICMDFTHSIFKWVSVVPR